MKIDKLTDKYNEEVAKFFEIEPLDFELKILKNRKEIDKIKGYKTQKWLIGFARDKTVYLLDKDKWETESAHPKSEFEGALKHEICHIYYNRIKGNSVPVWLNEGIAQYVSGQAYFGRIEKANIKMLEQNHTKQTSSFVSLFMVNRIMKEYGKKKLFELMKMGQQEERYKELKKMFKWLK